jgi:Flp pilus assembly protein TadD
MLARSYSVLGRSSDAEDKLLAAISSQNRGTVLRANLKRLALEIYGIEAN